MLTTRVVVSLISLAVLISSAGVVSGQNYPSRPIRIVTAAPGGGNDVAARLIAQGISGPLSQQVIVENRPSQIAKEIAAKAQPDGYTLYVVGNVLWGGPLTQNPDKPYNPLLEFSPISMVATRPFLLVAHPSLQANSIKELIALARARPGELNIARTSLGSDDHLAVELMKTMAKINMVVIPFNGGGPAIIGILGGQVQLLFQSLSGVQPHIKSGKLKALAVTGAQPSALSPGLPTVASAVPGFEVSGITGIYAPAKTPAVIINHLNREIVRFLKSPDGTEKFIAKGDDIVASSPQELVIRIKHEISKYSKLIKDAGIRAEAS